MFWNLNYRKFFFLVNLLFIHLNAGGQETELQSTFIVRKTTLWSEPTRFKEALAELYGGLKVSVLEYTTKSKWVRVQTPNGRVGWVMAADTSLVGRRSDPVVKDNEDEAPRESKFKDVNLKEMDFKNLWAMSLGAEYANQVSLSQTHGFGLGAQLYYHLTSQIALGAFYRWNRFQETEASEVDSVEVKRVAQRNMMGFLSRFYQQAFAFDFGLGMELMKSTFTAQDLTSGEPLSFDSSYCEGISSDGKVSDSAFALSASPAFRFPMGQKALMELYAEWSMAFYGGTALCGGEGKNPQQLGVGGRFLFVF